MLNWLPLLWHWLGLAAPALAVGLALAGIGAAFSKRNRPFASAVLWQAAINFIVGLAVLLLGLALTGHDGRMLTYLAMAAAMALAQALRMGR
jgi:VIT1/CCC1 family predicted Fe2+/Mn2+ transporter